MGTVDDFRAGQRAAWGAGEFDWIAERLWPVGGVLVEELEIGAGDDVVDVGCGTGNVSIQAAQAGARVTGVDLAPEMLARAGAGARSAGVELTLIEGDAEALPLPDRSADVVVSSFGCMFAPRHAMAAGEIMRVLRPGGRFGVCGWTLRSDVVAFLGMVAPHMPPPPAFAEPPPLWGDPDHVTEVFGPGATDLCFRHGTVDMSFASVDEAVHLYTERFGPLLLARELLEPQGRWQTLVDDLRAFFTERTRPDGAPDLLAEYLVSMGRRAPV